MLLLFLILAAGSALAAPVDVPVASVDVPATSAEIPVHISADITPSTTGSFAYIQLGDAVSGPTRTIPSIRIPGGVVYVNGDIAKCSGQSCDLANLSGSTGIEPTLNPRGGDANAYKCAAKYNPDGVKLAQSKPQTPPQPTGISGGLTTGMASLSGYLTFSIPDKGTFKGKCAPNMLFFAKGTTEPGELGITVGPVLNSALTGKDWRVIGVPYQADLFSDLCLGLPGGMMARDMLDQAAEKCPNSKLYMSGYSQGALVSHNAVGYAKQETKKRVAAVIVFGDPMQGAPIKGYNGPIITYCLEGDYVCTGNFVIGAAHLSYTGAPSTKAIAEIKKIAVGKKYTLK